MRQENRRMEQEKRLAASLTEAGDHKPRRMFFRSSCCWISDSRTAVRGKTTQSLPGPKSADRNQGIASPF
ncbi:hypothetical protein NDU88_008030 [Pleurodeles waltl]|uniref:Uncharacterized protein n=1 Tax=Pleurodeles waltl TaxID=8319 RepID=A0AAV7RVQ5_PLEWA|nr:hypothetical protein NDU88_008030 [Pleurodeles waltl]